MLPLEPEIIRFQALYLVFDGHMLHGAVDQIAHHGHVVVLLAEGLLGNANIPHGLRLLALSAPCAPPIPWRPSLVPAEAHDALCSRDSGALGRHVDGQLFHQQQEAPLALHPWHLDLHHPMLGAIHSRNPCVKERLELAGVEMMPYPRLGMIPKS